MTTSMMDNTGKDPRQMELSGMSDREIMSPSFESASLEPTLYFEDIEVGTKIAKPGAFEVTKEEIIEFARRWDPRPFHLDEAAAASSVFGGFAACSAHIFSILSWFAARGDRRTASLAAMGFDEVRLHHPVRPGDILCCAFTCLEKRESISRHDRGIVRYQGELSNQTETVVFSAVVTTMVAKRPKQDFA